ncbi:MAG: hypothetical protein Q8920_02900 [Bacillota bacterium]|nr:hypothetical protein [Bacillota bacterium]
MSQVIYDTFIYLLAVYGAIVLVISIAGSIHRSFNEYNPGMKLILEVKNQEEKIEGILRNLLAGNAIGRIIPVSSITVIDMGSTDDTLKILKLLSKDYECIKILEKQDAEKAVSEFEEHFHNKVI